MTMKTEATTIAIAYRDICDGKDPWVALGDFMHDFFASRRTALRFRENLLKDEPAMPEQVTPEQRQWAAFCAGAVEHLAHTYSLACPAWVEAPGYVLKTPWYDFGAPWGARSEVQALLREDTPAEFVRRNIICGDRVFLNPHEHVLPRQKKSA